ncbi:MAG: hypothetical protein IJI83_00070 [Oscillospiraceae bacterium]|nr:hypothetical protein [Oscillospiraceae bacterium]
MEKELRENQALNAHMLSFDCVQKKMEIPISRRYALFGFIFVAAFVIVWKAKMVLMKST